MSSAILRNITIVDTPGVLSGEKQRIGRDYNYVGEGGVKGVCLLMLSNASVCGRCGEMVCGSG